MGLGTYGICVEPDIMFIPNTIDHIIWTRFTDRHIEWDSHAQIDKSRAILMSDIMKMMGSCKIWSYLTVQYCAEWKAFLSEIVRNQISPPRATDFKMHFVVPEDGVTFFLHYNENCELLIWKNEIVFDAAFFDVIYGEYDIDNGEPDRVVTWDKLPTKYDATNPHEYMVRYRFREERYIKTHKYSPLFKQISIDRDSTPAEGLAYLLYGKRDIYYRE